jgi:hypothetical protein
VVRGLREGGGGGVSPQEPEAAEDNWFSLLLTSLPVPLTAENNNAFLVTVFVPLPKPMGG